MSATVVDDSDFHGLSSLVASRAAAAHEIQERHKQRLVNQYDDAEADED